MNLPVVIFRREEDRFPLPVFTSTSFTGMTERGILNKLTYKQSDNTSPVFSFHSFSWRFKFGPPVPLVNKKLMSLIIQIIIPGTIYNYTALLCNPLHFLMLRFFVISKYIASHNYICKIILKGCVYLNSFIIKFMASSALSFYLFPFISSHFHRGIILIFTFLISFSISSSSVIILKCSILYSSLAINRLSISLSKVFL